MGKNRAWNEGTGGWKGLSADKLNAVKLPEMIKCGRCNRNKHQPNFSTKALSEIKLKILEGYKNPVANCRTCTGGQVVELECIQCGKVKGLEEFAKAQRSNPDYAKCFVCMDKHLALTPINEDKYDAGQITNDPINKVVDEEASQLEYFESHYASSLASEHEDSSYGGGVALNRELRKLKIADHTSRSTTEDDDSFAKPTDPWALYDSSDTGFGSSAVGAATGGVAVAGTENDDEWSIAKGKFKGSSTAKATSVGNSSLSRAGFDSKRYGHPGGGSISGSSVSGSIHSTATERTNNAGGSKFAKIKAYRPPTPPEVDEWKSDDEEESKGYKNDTDSEPELPDI